MQWIYQSLKIDFEVFIKRPNFFNKVDPVWQKVLFFAVSVFFIFLGDAVLSFWAPNLMEEKLGSASLMGLVMAFSSFVGLMVDLVLPSVLSNLSIRKFLFLAILTSIVFALLLILGVSLPLIFIFLLSMAVWGLYYEFVIFAGQLFVAKNIPFKLHSGAWAIIGIFKNLAYLLGPIIAGILIKQSEILIGFAAILITCFGFLSLLVAKKGNSEILEVDFKKINLWAEIKKWKTLFKRIWPVIIISLVLGLIDSIFWTTGATYTESLSKTSAVGGLFLSLYQVPSLFIGLLVAKLGVYSGKKKLAETFLLLAGIFLSFFAFDGGIYFILLLVFVSSLFLAFTYPMIDGVYSDIVDRMGKEKKHLIGFSSASISFAYIIGPIISGVLADKLGERHSFFAIGLFVIFMATVLLLTTPKKLKLPQEEIGKW